MGKQPIVSYTFHDVPLDQQEIIKTVVQQNLDGKMDSYLKKIYDNKENAEVRIEYKVSQNKTGKFESSFLFHFDGQQFLYNNKTAFKYPEDLVNHAFQHFKEYLSKMNVKW